MKLKLKQFLQNFVKLNDEEFIQISNACTISSLKKKDILFREGQVANQLIFFFDGYFRFYHYQSDNEITSDFYFAPNIVTSYTSLIMGEPSRVYVQAMEDMEVLILKKSNLEKLYKQFHNIDKLGRMLAEQVVISSEKHLFSILSQTAEERYKNLLTTYPQFIQKIPLQYIASYLGITKETLSRIRKRV